MKSINGYKSDEGWGCMIRVAQMMCAHAFVKHNQYRFNEFTIQQHFETILPLFLDNGEDFEAPMSIRNILKVGKEIIDKGPGQWYGAHSISQVMKEVHLMYNTHIEKTLGFVTFNEGVVYKSDLINEDPENDRSFLISIPLRVGLEKVDKAYIPQLKEVLLYPD